MKKPIRSKAIRESARGEPCTVRIPGICNGNPETTVLAHLGGGGMGTKRGDIFGAYCCSSCHDALDGRMKTDYPKGTLELWHRHGVERTQEILVEQGLIMVAG